MYLETKRIDWAVLLTTDNFSERRPSIIVCWFFLIVKLLTLFPSVVKGHPLPPPDLSGLVLVAFALWWFNILHWFEVLTSPVSFWYSLLDCPKDVCLGSV
jgi:hypothetical protein